MTNVGNDEQILDHFRKWLQETRQEAAEIDEGASGEVPALPRVGLERLVEEFTALRHELKLQTRSSRSLEERVEASLSSLTEAAAAFRLAASQKTSAGSEAAEKAFAMTLAELDEALERGREQWTKMGSRLIGSTSPTSSSPLQELYAEQSWWHRWLTAAYHRRICQQIERAEEQARADRQAVLTALLNGYGLIQQRLTRAMVNAGVVRIPSLGRPVDPELMIVVEVVDDEGSPGQVIEEVRRGYTWKGGLLRPAEVRAIRPQYERETKDGPPETIPDTQS